MPPCLPSPRPGIDDITAYVPGDSDASGGVEPIKLSSNETPLGASAKAVAAYRNEGDTLARYPDGSSAPLRAAIAAKYGLNAGHIVCGAGSDEILNLLANAYLRPGDEAIYTQYGFMVYRIVILANSATPVIAPERQYTTDVDAILARASDRTRIVFLANPNNPTGTYMAIEEVRRLRAGLPDHTLLVLDAAYAEYVRRNDYEAGIELVATTPNTVMTRTFSKIHGLAGLRLGWAYCPVAIADVLNRIRGPFNVSSAAIAAGTAAIADDAHLQRSIAHNDEWLPWITEALVNIGIEVTPSVANFVLLHFPTDAGRDAAAADAHLRARAIIVRRMDGYGLPGALRLTIGTSQENHAVVEALTDFMRDTSGSGMPA